MMGAPFADFTWRHARRVVAESGREVTETEIARALDALLTRAEHGPDTAGRTIAARTRVGASSHRPPSLAAPAPPSDDSGTEVPGDSEEATLATVIPFGIFDADAEADRW
jgi:hypothetical protein